MSNLFRNLKPETKLHRNGFDLSRRELYTQVAGELLPTMVIDCVPGDKHVIDMSSLVRTMPLNTAAFARIKHYHHFFFVPYSILWSQWDSFITQRKNLISSNANNSLFVPSVNLHSLYNKYTALGTQYRKDLFGFDYNDRIPKLLEHLGYGNYYFGESNEADYSVNLFRLAAYNKIWYDFYRNPYYDENVRTSRSEYVFQWNFDDFSCSSFETSDLFNQRMGSQFATEDFCEMFTVKYRQYRKDILTSLLPDTQFGSVSYLPVGSDKNNPFYLQEKHPSGSFSNPYVLLNSSGASGQFSDVGVGSAALQVPSQFVADNLGFDVLQLRKAEYLQRWKETTLRAGQQALSQYDAHFGVRPRHTVDHTAEFIAGFDDTVMIDEVITTANDSVDGTSVSSGAGEVFGKGIKVSDNNKLVFEATEFGVFMCISSFLPQTDYDGALMCDRNNRLFEPFDFFTPEFQNLGMEPVTYENINADNAMLQDNLTVIGYAPRFWNYKSAFDKIHGGFTFEGSGGTDVGLINWVTPRRDFRNFNQGLTRQSLYVNPKILDPIFAQGYNGQCIYDQFMCNDYYDVKSIRPMSILGLPEW